MKAQLDHLVVDVHDRLDEGRKRWEALGFHVTPRGRHSLGSANHLMILGTDYLELLGWEGGAPPRPELADFPIGLNGLVFRDWNHEELYPALKARGVPVQEPRSFIRPVGLEDGSIAGDARFTTTRLERGAGALDGRIYYCQHYTPELVWREEWRRHANTAQEVSRVVIASKDAGKPMGLLGAMFPGAVQGSTLGLGTAKVEAVPHASLGDLLPVAGGRGDYLALIGFRCADMARCEAALKAGGVPYRKQGAALQVLPAETMNVALEFHA